MIRSVEHSLISSIVGYLDKQKFFGYAAIMNPSTSQDLKIYSAKPKVIIIDTRTGYFNASKLIDAFCDNEGKTYAKATSSTAYKKHMEQIDIALNNLPDDEKKKFKGTPAVTSRCDGTFLISSSYKVAKCKLTYYDGMYLHPSTLIHILIYANSAYASYISAITLNNMLQMGLDNSITFHDNIFTENAKTDRLIANRKKYIDDDIVENEHYEKVQYEKLLRYVTYEEETLQKLKKSVSDHLVATHAQAVIVIRKYSEENNYDGSEEFYKLNIRVVGFNDLKFYVNEYDVKSLIERTEEELAVWGRQRAYTHIICKIGPLRGVSLDFGIQCANHAQDRCNLYVEGDDIYVNRNDYKAFEDIIKSMLFLFEDR